MNMCICSRISATSANLCDVATSITRRRFSGKISGFGFGSSAHGGAVCYLQGTTAVFQSTELSCTPSPAHFTLEVFLELHIN